MLEFNSPYLPGRPVTDPELFFGRRDVLGSIRENLVRGRRVFVVAGARRMGKTSLMCRLAKELPEDLLGVSLPLREESTPRLDWLLWRLADAITVQLREHVGAEIPDPDWTDFEGRPLVFLEGFWPAVRVLLGHRDLVLLLDDLDSLEARERGLEARFADFLAGWRAVHPSLGVVLTTSPSHMETLLRDHPKLLGGAQTTVLGSLSGEDATRLVTWPVDGVLTYDYGVPRRLIEVASGHPYFLQLLCHEVFNRCSQSGWVNQRDLDLILEELVAKEVPEFRQAWDGSSPEGQAVLAALVSIRGARGVATVQEVQTVLSREGSRARREAVEAALERLATREILERLGAQSYRFRVGLLRDWLSERIEVRQVVREARWSVTRQGQAKAEISARRPRTRRRRRAVSREPEGQDEDAQPVIQERFRSRRGVWIWTGLAAVLLLSAATVTGIQLLGRDRVGRSATPTADRTSIVSISGLQTLPVPAENRTPVSSSLSTGTPTVQHRPSEISDATPLPSPTLQPSPTASPFPSPPVVVSRPVPAIAYLSRPSAGGDWSLWLMNSDGTSRSRLLPAGASFLSAPSWSPDGSRLAFISDQSGSSDVWAAAVDGSDAVNLTGDEPQDHSPAWSPDGEWIAFASVREAVHWEIYVMRADGTDVQRVTWWDDASDLSPSWSPDGRRLAFASKRDGNWEIYSVDVDGGALVRLTEHPADDTHPSWSPDGSRIAFESARDGFTDIYVMAASGGGATNLTKLDWATDLGPTWSPDGGRLAFYSDRDGEWDVYVMASDGSDVTKLTADESMDQLPSWRP